MKPPIKIVLLDVLKPHKPDLAEFSQEICKDKSVSCVNASVAAIDEKTESVKLVIEGADINMKNVIKTIEKIGAVVHSIDKVVVGKKEIIQV